MCATQLPAGDRTAVVSRVLTAEPYTPRAARDLVQRALVAAGVTSGPVLENLRLAVSEAVTNAVEHAYAAADARPEATVELTLRVDADRVTITVADRGRWREPARHPHHRGRGIALMRGLVDHLEIHCDGTGTRVVLGHTLAAR